MVYGPRIAARKGWFQDERFKAAVRRAGTVKREIYLANPKLD